MRELKNTWWEVVALAGLCWLGSIGAHVGWGILGGLLLGVDSLLALLRAGAVYGDAPMSARKFAIYAEAVAFGALVGVAAWIVGWLVHVVLVR